jgi:hypothetical protein
MQYMPEKNGLTQPTQTSNSKKFQRKNRTQFAPNYKTTYTTVCTTTCTNQQTKRHYWMETFCERKDSCREKIAKIKQKLTTKANWNQRIKQKKSLTKRRKGYFDPRDGNAYY